MRYRAAVMSILLIFVLVLAACGGTSSSSSSGGDSGSGSSGDSGGSSGSSASGSPDAAALGFVNALLTGGDASSFLCGAAGDVLSTYSEGVQQAVNAFSAAGGELNIDTSGLSASAANVDTDSADVTVSGSYSISVSIAGQSTTQSADFSATTFSMVSEGGAWKVCGIATP